MYILRASITLKDGSKIYASTYGKRAFRIWIGPGPELNKGNQLTKTRGIFTSWSVSAKRKAENNG